MKQIVNGVEYQAVPEISSGADACNGCVADYNDDGDAVKVGLCRELECRGGIVFILPDKYTEYLAARLLR